MAEQEALELEWIRVNAALRSYIEEPEKHTAAIFLKGRMSAETRERLQRERNLVVGASFGEYQTIERAPGNTVDALAMEPK